MSGLLSADDTITRALRAYTAHGLTAISVRVLRDNGLGIERDPLPQDPSHVLVYGEKSPAIRGRLVQAAVWLVKVPGYEREICTPVSP